MRVSQRDLTILSRRAQKQHGSGSVKHLVECNSTSSERLNLVYFSFTYSVYPGSNFILVLFVPLF